MIINSILGSDRLHTWSKTFPQGHTTTQELVTADEWLKAHWNDEGLVIVVNSVGVVYPGSGSYITKNVAFNSYPITPASGSEYKQQRFSVNSSGTPGHSSTAKPLTDSKVTAGFLRVDADGNLYTEATDSYKIAPATYKIYAFIMR